MNINLDNPERMEIFPDGRVNFPGIDKGPDVTLHHVQRALRGLYVITIRVGGHKYWSSIGHQGYAPAVFQTFVSEENPEQWPSRGRPIIAHRLIEIPVRKVHS